MHSTKAAKKRADATSPGTKEQEEAKKGKSRVAGEEEEEEEVLRSAIGRERRA